MNNSKTVLIVGCARSGTTLLSELLSQHPDIFISPETKYFQYIYSQRFLLKLLPEKERYKLYLKSLINAEYSNREQSIIPQYSDELLKAFSRQKDLSILFNDILSIICGEHQIVGEKTPWHTFFVDKVSSDCKVIAITRRAVPNIASLYKRKGFRNVKTIDACMSRWIHTNESILSFASGINSNKRTRIKFEDLIENPERTLTSICDFLGVEFDPLMLNPIGQDSSNIGINSSKKSIDKNANNRFNIKIDDNQARYIASYAGDLEKRLGYDAIEVENRVIKYPPKLAYELIRQKLGVMVMRSGFYPFGALRYF